MASLQRSILEAVVLWERDDVSCSCLSPDADTIVITLTVDGVVVDRQTFSNADKASEFAIDKMHAYDAD